MFSRQTVFILGAGASWHYGYPTGEELVKMVIKRAIMARDQFQRSLSQKNVHFPAYIKKKFPPNPSTTDHNAAWQSAINECQQLATSLIQTNPLVIDYFLGQNKGLQEIGKLIIAWVILECEAVYKKENGNINRKLNLLNSPKASDRNEGALLDITKCNDDWGRFVLHKMVGDCSMSNNLNSNKVSFVTFNYDISLEHKLYRGLRGIELFNEADVKYFLNSDRIIHIYGKVFNSPAWDYRSIDLDVISADSSVQMKYGRNPNQFFIDYQTFLDIIFEASRDLRVISDHKGLNDDIINKAADAINTAEDIYILGYGFDDQNSQRLKLQILQKNKVNKSVRIFFTNYGDRNSINKKASHQFFGEPEFFLPPNSPIHKDVVTRVSGPSTTHFPVHYEKSNREVYEALERDFEL